MKDYLKLIISLAIPQIAGAIGSIFTVSSVSTWYLELMKPSFNPPSWVFGPVWTTLFVLIGVALFLVWKKGWKNNKIALYVFSAQMVFNVIWSALFFGLRSPFLALIEIFILSILIALNICYFYRISKPAAYLLVPYFVWVCFAAVLNYYLFVLNH
ncbi:TspO protein [Candidatus Woesearchaeota archaeon CG_4_10_14_0_2_um_filter_33_13]|nr:MAG: TspO protein [Candidatus Woesearchaeota archaeon CG_4_10_14_0_2_um_filter_33_13]